ncbi:unnamed protein product [Absidia cylindrospora]
MATDATATKEVSTEPVRTLAFEYALSPNYQCNICRKSILRRTLCLNTIERANKKQKKKTLAPLDSCHFKCWIVPAEFKRKPLEAFRGYSKLKDFDKKRMQRLYEAGPGSSWPAIVAADEEERLAAEEAEAEAAEAQQEGDFTKKPVQTQPKPTKRKAKDDDEEHDMTKALTGAQLPTQVTATDKKAAATNKKAKKNTPIEENESTTAKKEKTTKKKEAPKPAVKLDDKLGEGFTDEFKKILEDFKQ